MRKVLQQLLFIFAITIIVTSCEKGEEPFPTSVNTEKTLVSLPDAAGSSFITLAVDLNPGITTLNVLELQRDTKGAADLNKPLTVKVKNQNALISEATGGEVHELPRNLYTNHPDNPFDGQYWTVTFKPGESKAYLKILINLAVLITSPTRVGLGFQIAEVPGDAQISDSKGQLGVELSAKNQWDGTYAVRGPVVDVFASNLVEWVNQPGYNSPTWLVDHPGAWEAYLITVSATECVLFDNTVWGLPAIPLFNTAAVPPTAPNTGYGSFGLIITFDPATNKVSKVRNYYGDPTAGPANPLGNPALGTGPPLYQSTANSRYALLDPTGANTVQANKDISIKYQMFQPNTVPVGARTTFNQTFEYIGPR
jgi:hypothetical protein